MRIRKNIMPKRLVDILCFLLIAIFLPIVFFFEMFVVLPAFHDPGGFLYYFTFVVAIFIVFNVKSNMLACMMIDTSVDCIMINPPNEAEKNGWWFCKICQKSMPPRSWHCKTCRTCILKRDHHCLFTGCCIGHNNHRYFMMFITYMLFGSIYAFVYNSLYLWKLNAHIYWNMFSVLKMLCPMLMFITGSTLQNFYLIFYNLNIVAVLYSVLLVIYHWPMVWRGGVCHERSKQYPFDSGWKQNLQYVFGDRMHLIWIAPFIQSSLIHNGIEWNVKVPTKINKKDR